MTSIHNVYYIKRNLFSIFVNGMSIKCLKNTWQEIFYTSIFTPIMKHNLNAPQERNDSFATSNKIKCLKIHVLVQSN